LAPAQRLEELLPPICIPAQLQCVTAGGNKTVILLVKRLSQSSIILASVMGRIDAAEVTVFGECDMRNSRLFSLKDSG
jgi:hypothetical protein